MISWSRTRLEPRSSWTSGPGATSRRIKRADGRPSAPWTCGRARRERSPGGPSGGGGGTGRLGLPRQARPQPHSASEPPQQRRLSRPTTAPTTTLKMRFLWNGRRRMWASLRGCETSPIRPHDSGHACPATRVPGYDALGPPRHDIWRRVLHGGNTGLAALHLTDTEPTGTHKNRPIGRALRDPEGGSTRCGRGDQI